MSTPPDRMFITSGVKRRLIDSPSTQDILNGDCMRLTTTPDIARVLTEESNRVDYDQRMSSLLSPSCPTSFLEEPNVIESWISLPPKSKRIHPEYLHSTELLIKPSSMTMVGSILSILEDFGSCISSTSVPICEQILPCQEIPGSQLPDPVISSPHLQVIIPQTKIISCSPNNSSSIM